MRVALFATCLVDHLFPEVAKAASRILRRLGLEVVFPPSQTCCGQPPFNDGFWTEAQAMARYHLGVFTECDAVVVPSGSCVTMIRRFYPLLFESDSTVLPTVEKLGARTYELSEFLVRRLGVTDVGATFRGRVTYLASCHGYRELHLEDEPLALLRAVHGLEYVGLEDMEECCGFGGAFSVKMADISGAMLASKIAAIRKTGADVVTATDASCLMHVRGGLLRLGVPIRTVHLAEVLAAEG